MTIFIIVYSYYLVVGAMVHQSAGVNVSKVQYCPLDNESFIISSKRFGKCDKASERYHCVLSTKEEYFEGCVAVTQVERNKCPRYTWVSDEEFVVKFVNCSTSFNRTCPDSQYVSTSLHNYSGCYTDHVDRFNVSSTSAIIGSSNSTNSLEISPPGKGILSKTGELVLIGIGGAITVLLFPILVTVCCIRKLFIKPKETVGRNAAHQRNVAMSQVYFEIDDIESTPRNEDTMRNADNSRQNQFVDGIYSMKEAAMTS